MSKFFLMGVSVVLAAVQGGLKELSSNASLTTFGAGGDVSSPSMDSPKFDVSPSPYSAILMGSPSPSPSPKVDCDEPIDQLITDCVNSCGGKAGTCSNACMESCGYCKTDGGTYAPCSTSSSPSLSPSLSSSPFSSPSPSPSLSPDAPSTPSTSKKIELDLVLIFNLAASALSIGFAYVRGKRNWKKLGLHPSCREKGAALALPAASLAAATGTWAIRALTESDAQVIVSTIVLVVTVPGVTLFYDRCCGKRRGSAQDANAWARPRPRPGEESEEVQAMLNYQRPEDPENLLIDTRSCVDKYCLVS